jgi:putative PIN family toxin of toxin-antitoxin system
VFDTNVVLSALVFSEGRIATLRGAWRDAKCRPLVSRPTIEELMRALAYPKFKLSAMEQQELIAEYLPYCTTVRLPAKLPPVPACRDPMDRPFLELAVIGKAEYLVTGDKDLLALAKTFVCPIVGPEALLERIAKR